MAKNNLIFYVKIVKKAPHICEVLANLSLKQFIGVPYLTLAGVKMQCYLPLT